MWRVRTLIDMLARTDSAAKVYVGRDLGDLTELSELVHIPNTESVVLVPAEKK